MSKPIAQSFYVNQPVGQGSDGVYVTSVDVYFQSVSTQYGIELQIRTIENGLPTSNRLPFASKILLPTDTYPNTSPIVISSLDASSPTKFTFDTPVFLQTNKQYALVLIPVGGNPDYNVWCGKISENDVNTGTPIYTNNDTGDLFQSSNDLTWSPITFEDMKFSIYIANFTSNQGTAYFKSPSEECLVVTEKTNSFIPRERIIIGYPSIETAIMSVNSVSGTFSVGDIVYQTNPITNIDAYGKVYFANSSMIKVLGNSNKRPFFVTNSISGTPKLFNASQNANAFVQSISQDNVTTASNNIISVPDSSQFTTNDVIYVQSSNTTAIRICDISSIPSNTTLAVTPRRNVSLFSDSSAIIGKVFASPEKIVSYGTLTEGSTIKSNRFEETSTIFINQSSANSSWNLSNIDIQTNLRKPILIGAQSQASARIMSFGYRGYNSISTSFLTSAPSNTSLGFSFKGTKTDSTLESEYVLFNNGNINEFFDYERKLLGISEEYYLLNSNSSLIIKTDLQTENSLVSPVIDNIDLSASFTKNMIVQEKHLEGCKLSLKKSNTSLISSNNTLISQTSNGITSTGVVFSSNNTMAMVQVLSGKFVSNSNISTLSGQTANVINVIPFGESIGTTINENSSRYISKNIILANNQDSEDLKLYLTAFRPSMTNICVYAKILNSADNDLFDNKDWSKLTELSVGLYSNPINTNDRYELNYTFNTSELIYNSNTVVSNTTANVYFTSTSNFMSNEFIYLSDSTSNSFNVRQIINVVNATCVIIDKLPTFSSSNAAVGLIPGIQSSSSAFQYDQNNNIVRYCTSDDNIFDRYIQFAIKLVPTSNNSAIVPRISDVRAIAMQV